MKKRESLSSCGIGKVQQEDGVDVGEVWGESALKQLAEAEDKAAAYQEIYGSGEYGDVYFGGLDSP